MIKGIINMQNNQKVIPLRPERRPETGAESGLKTGGTMGETE